MDATVEDWVRVCAVEDIPLLGSRVLKREGGDDIALFRPAAARVLRSPTAARTRAGHCRRELSRATP